jgi:hypothetical protein
MKTKVKNIKTTVKIFFSQHGKKQTGRRGKPRKKKEKVTHLVRDRVRGGKLKWGLDVVE